MVSDVMNLTRFVSVKPNKNKLDFISRVFSTKFGQIYIWFRFRDLLAFCTQNLSNYCRHKVWSVNFTNFLILIFGVWHKKWRYSFMINNMIGYISKSQKRSLMGNDIWTIRSTSFSWRKNQNRRDLKDTPEQISLSINDLP